MIEEKTTAARNKRSAAVLKARASNSWAERLDFLWLEITNRCNLRCVHCYAESSPDQPLSTMMKYEDWCAVMRQAADLGCKKIQFIGGEPTVHPRLLDLVTQATQMGYRFIEIFTNGMRLTEGMCQFLSAHSVHLAVSVYGSSPVAHDAITTREGSFVKTVSGIEKALKHNIPVRVGIISMEENQDDVGETKAFLESLGLTNIGVDRLRRVGRGNGRGQSTDQYGELCGGCWKGRLAVNSAGYVSPCVFAHFCNVGHVSEGLANILAHHSLHEFRARVRDMTIQTDCNPPECNPRCFPKNCDPDICDPINCRPLD